MRHEFPARIKALAAQRANGRCEICGKHLFAGDHRYDHRIADGIGGKNDLENCQLLCRNCHDAKTPKDIKAISKARRNYRKANGIKKPRRITRWRRFDGSIVTAPRER